jgi:hypothetical protein
MIESEIAFGSFELSKPYSVDNLFTLYAEEPLREDTTGLTPKKRTVEKCSSARVERAEGNEEESI